MYQQVIAAARPPVQLPFVNAAHAGIVELSDEEASKTAGGFSEMAYYDAGGGGGGSGSGVVEAGVGSYIWDVISKGIIFEAAKELWNRAGVAGNNPPPNENDNGGTSYGTGTFNTFGAFLWECDYYSGPFSCLESRGPMDSGGGGGRGLDYGEINYGGGGGGGDYGGGGGGGGGGMFFMLD